MPVLPSKEALTKLCISFTLNDLLIAFSDSIYFDINLIIPNNLLFDLSIMFIIFPI